MEKPVGAKHGNGNTNMNNKFLVGGASAVVGFLLGIVATFGYFEAASSNAYEQGYSEGVSAGWQECHKPSKLEKGTRAVTEWLVKP